MLKDALSTRPFITLEWDEGSRWDIPAGPADYERVSIGLPAWLAQLEGGGDLEAVRSTFAFLCGEELGSEIYGKCLDHLTGGAEMDPDALAQYMMPALDAICTAWLEQVRAVKEMRRRRFAHYLGGDEDAV